MSSREAILKAIRENKPEAKEIVDFHWTVEAGNLVEKFSSTLQQIGGSIFEINNHAPLLEYIHQHYPEPAKIINCVPSLNIAGVAMPEDPADLETVDLSIIEGTCGVAENGAIWIDENQLPHRVLPFICQHLAIVLSRTKIVANMHEAYQRIEISSSGFGTFIAGPSKTADIEQSLVIGAHGARSLVVFILED